MNQEQIEKTMTVIAYLQNQIELKGGYASLAPPCAQTAMKELKAWYDVFSHAEIASSSLVPAKAVYETYCSARYGCLGDKAQLPILRAFAVFVFTTMERFSTYSFSIMSPDKGILNHDNGSVTVKLGSRYQYGCAVGLRDSLNNLMIHGAAFMRDTASALEAKMEDKPNPQLCDYYYSMISAFINELKKVITYASVLQVKRGKTSKK